MRVLMLIAALLLWSSAPEARPRRGGYYKGGHGSSHKGGHYRNSATGNRYRRR